MRYKCNKCDFECNDRDDFDDHIKMHDEDDPEE